MAGELSWASSQSSSSSTYAVQHRIVLSVSEVEVVDLESWDQSQLGSNCVYPLREVRSDERVLKVTRDTVMANCTSQRQGVVRQDRWDLLRVSQIIAVFSSFLSHGSARPSSSRGGCLQSTIDDACIPTDMTFSAMRSIKISSTDFSSALCSPDIHTCNQTDRVGE
jgi:hypothetical protein